MTILLNLEIRHDLIDDLKDIARKAGVPVEDAARAAIAEFVWREKNRGWVPVTEYAEMTMKSHSTVRRHIRHGLLQTMKLGGRVFVRLT